MMQPARTRRRGFTRVELSVAVLLGLTVTAVGMPIAQRVREAANRATCQNNLKAIGIAIHNYASASRDKLPPMLDYTPSNGLYWQPFWFTLLPYIEQDAVFKRAYNSGAGWNNNNHVAVFKDLLCPSDASHDGGVCTSGATKWGGTSYAPNYMVFGSSNLFNPDEKVFISQGKYSIGNLPDGTSNTIGVVERLTSFPKYGWSNATLYPMDQNNWGLSSYGSAYGVWGLRPPQTGATATGPGAGHPHYATSAHNVCQLLLMDGSVKAIKSTIHPDTWKYACIPDDGAALPDF